MTCDVFLTDFYKNAKQNENSENVVITSKINNYPTDRNNQFNKNTPPSPIKIKSTKSKNRHKKKKSKNSNVNNTMKMDQKDGSERKKKPKINPQPQHSDHSQKKEDLAENKTKVKDNIIIIDNEKKLIENLEDLQELSFELLTVMEANVLSAYCPKSLNGVTATMTAEKLLTIEENNPIDITQTKKQKEEENSQ